MGVKVYCEEFNFQTTINILWKLNQVRHLYEFHLLTTSAMPRKIFNFFKVVFSSYFRNMGFAIERVRKIIKVRVHRIMCH